MPSLLLLLRCDMPTATKIDPSLKANQDRMNRNKMNRLQRVQELPARGGVGDWVVRLEEQTVGEERFEVEQVYAWVENRWVAIGGLGNFLGQDTDVNFLGEV